MVFQAIPCPHCGQTKPVIKHGKTEINNQRYRCLECKKTFCQHPKSRRTDSQTLEAIERALEERMPMNAIKRTFKVGWDTIEKVAKKNYKTAD
jgi:transposase-like protein